MQWLGRRESDNVEDNRGGGGGGGGRFALGGGIISIIALAIYYFTGVDTSQLLNQVASNGQVQTEQQARDPNAPKDSASRFVGVILADTEDIWTKIFSDMGKTYVKPHLSLFRNYIESGCGKIGRAHV